MRSSSESASSAHTLPGGSPYRMTRWAQVNLRSESPDSLAASCMATSRWYSGSLRLSAMVVAPQKAHRMLAHDPAVADALSQHVGCDALGTDGREHRLRGPFLDRDIRRAGVTEARHRLDALL